MSFSATQCWRVSRVLRDATRRMSESCEPQSGYTPRRACYMRRRRRGTVCYVRAGCQQMRRYAREEQRLYVDVAALPRAAQARHHEAVARHIPHMFTDCPLMICSVFT